MTVEEAISFLDGVLAPEHLSDVEELIFRSAWEGEAYKDIADRAGYDREYIKRVGSELWQLLSRTFGEKVTKSNFQSMLRRRSQQMFAASQTTARPAAVGELRSEQVANVPPGLYQDWGEAIDVSFFYGRAEERSKLRQWIADDRCRLVALLGMGGIGKTALTAKLTEEIQGEFEYLIWRSLRHAPSIQVTLAELNEFLPGSPQTSVPATADGQISRLLTCLRTHRCLLILDDWEMVLRSGDLAGYYRKGYEGYGKLIKRVGEERHQSCLLLATREKPVEIASLAGENLPVRALQLKGLKQADAKRLLANKGFSGAENGLEELIQLYRGNPAALKIVATTIQELFNGNIAQFLEQTSLVLGDILEELVSQQFERLSGLGKTIAYWLAIERQPVSLSTLKRDMFGTVSCSELLAVLESLKRRSLVEKEENVSGEALFTIQPVVMKYVTNKLIEQVCKDITELIKAQPLDKLGLLKSHVLVKEQEPDDIKAMQVRLILSRVQERLRLTLGGENQMETQLNDVLLMLRGYPPQAVGYAGENLLKLLE